MDWTNRGGHPNQSLNQPAGSVNSSSHKSKPNQGLFRVAAVVLLFSATLLIIALLLYTAFFKKPVNEAKFVDTSKFQAVFLNGGQVYFGHITSLNNSFLRLDNIFYLQVNQQVQPNGQTQQTGNPTLVPLGCELHRPQDEMVINRQQIVFWENLKDDSNTNTVPGAIKQYIAANPNGQTCKTTSSSSTTSK